jgi:hypothetical protein
MDFSNGEIATNVPQVYLVRDLEAQTFKLVKT